MAVNPDKNFDLCQYRNDVCPVMAGYLFGDGLAY